MKVKLFLSAILICCLSILNNTALAQSGSNTLASGAKLTEGQRLISKNNTYYLAMQNDGNLCIKKLSDNGFVWCSMEYKGSGSYLTLQADGNLVVYDKNNKAVWYSMTQAYYDSKYGAADMKPVRAVLEDNGTLSLYSATNKKVWDNNYKGEQPAVPPSEGFVGQTSNKNIKVSLPFSKGVQDIPVQITNSGQIFYDADMNLGNIANLNNGQFTDDKGSSRWPNSTVPYVLPATHPKRDLIQKGIDELNKKTNICLVPRTNEKNYVEFILTDGNWAALGMVGGRQEISISNNPNLKFGTVCHEIMHSLGFYHTQAREDRDNFVTINFRNIQSSYQDQFYKQTDKASNLGSYDYGSCMHYFSTAFAVNNKVNTINAKKGGKDVESLMGNRDSVSHMDIINISDVYPPCPSKATKKPYVTRETANLPTNGLVNTNITTTPTTVAANCDAKDAVKKYQTSMQLGNRLLKKEKLVSANGRYQFRVSTDGNFVIEETLNSGNCPYKEVYRFPLVNGGSNPKVSLFSYNTDGNVCMDNNKGQTYCATSGQDANAAVILSNSVKLELTDDGRLRLVNKQSQEIWATSAAKSAPANTNTPQPPGNTATNKPPTNAPTNAPITDLPEVFIKGKPILNVNESIGIGQTLTSENNQYQCRVIKQKIDIGRGRMQEQNRFVIERITLGNVNGKQMVTGKTEIWNRECKEGMIMGNDKKVGSASRFQECFYDAPLASNAISARTGMEIHFGQIKLENDGTLNLIYDGYYKVKLCPVGVQEFSKKELHYRTPAALLTTPGYERLEIGQTLTSDNGQYQCRITPEKRFIIEKITIGTKENGEKFVTSRTEIWNKECKEGFLEIKGSTLQPDCFKKEVPVIDKTKPYRIPQGQKARAWKLENDGTIKWYANTLLSDQGFTTCNPYN